MASHHLRRKKGLEDYLLHHGGRYNVYHQCIYAFGTRFFWRSYGDHFEASDINSGGSLQLEVVPLAGATAIEQAVRLMLDGFGCHLGRNLLSAGAPGGAYYVSERCIYDEDLTRLTRKHNVYVRDCFNQLDCMGCPTVEAVCELGSHTALTSEGVYMCRDKYFTWTQADQLPRDLLQWFDRRDVWMHQGTINCEHGIMNSAAWSGTRSDFIDYAVANGLEDLL